MNETVEKMRIAMSDLKSAISLSWIDDDGNFACYEYNGTAKAIPIAVATLLSFRDPKPKTNADKLRAMSDEELAEFCQYKDCPTVEKMLLCSNEGDHDCYNCWLDWLRQEASE